jgi:sorbitol-specific phosphotransferase system component IIC
VHPALLWLFIAAGVILLRLNRLVALTYFGVGVLAVVVRAIMTRRHSL